MIILAICMLEELNMLDKYGSDYNNYRKSTPFLFPVPSWLMKILKAPGRLVIRKEYPEKRRDVGLIITVYTIILIIFSLPFLDVKTYGYPTFFNKTRAGKQTIESILEIIKGETDRRTMSAYFNYFEPFGTDAVEALTGLLGDSNPIKREFASNLLGRINSPGVVNTFT